VQAEYFIPVFTRQTILIGMKGAMIASDSLYDNEVFRIGGLRTIRGINEESIFATAWSLVTLEYRWLLEENSAVFVFLDQAWYEYKSIQGYLRDVPISVGAGVNFETKAGIFTFNYALGKQFENPVLIRNGKISFGFRSLF
jgi:hemolysin activation/secretion protein